MPIATAILQLFNCMNIDSRAELRPAVPSPYAGNRLVQDMTQVCFQGKHFYYAVTVGVLGLVFICLGVRAPAHHRSVSGPEMHAASYTGVDGRTSGGFIFLLMTL